MTHAASRRPQGSPITNGGDDNVAEHHQRTPLDEDPHTAAGSGAAGLRRRLVSGLRATADAAAAATVGWPRNPPATSSSLGTITSTDGEAEAEAEGGFQQPVERYLVTPASVAAPMDRAAGGGGGAEAGGGSGKGKAEAKAGRRPRPSLLRTYLALQAVFLVSGLWHILIFWWVAGAWLEGNTLGRGRRRSISVVDVVVGCTAGLSPWHESVHSWAHAVIEYVSGPNYCWLRQSECL